MNETSRRRNRKRSSSNDVAENRENRQASGNLQEPAKPDSQALAQLISIDNVRIPPKQPRRYFDPNKLNQLAASIEQFGILEPLIVRPIENGQYELVAGERRYRAAKQVGLEKIPVIVRDIDEKQAFELALLENLQRDDLNPIDETEGILELLSQSLQLSTAAIISLLNRAANAQKRGQSLTDNVIRQIEVVDNLFLTVGRLNRESFRTNRLPLLNLPEDVLAVLRQGELEYTKAKAIARIPDEKQRKQLMQQVIDEQLSLSELKQHIGELQAQLKGNSSSRNLRDEFKAITRFKSLAWEDTSKYERLEELLTELKGLLEA